VAWHHSTVLPLTTDVFTMMRRNWGRKRRCG